MTGRLKIGSLFSGVGGLDLGVTDVFDAETVWFCEFDTNPSKVLAARFPDVPNLGDITAVNWAELPPIDILIGGFPCQDVSSAGLRAGIKEGTRSGLWSYFLEGIDALRPRFVVIENVRGLLTAEAHRENNDESSDSNVESGDPTVGDTASGPVLRAAGAVLGGLADIGYDAQWVTVPASLWGTPHRRERVFVLAYPAGVGLQAVRDSLREPEARQWLNGSVYQDAGSRAVLTKLLPTPKANDENATRNTTYNRGENNKTVAGSYGDSLTDVVYKMTGRAEGTGADPKLLPTPTLSDEKTPGNADERRAAGHMVNLADVATTELTTLLPTPRSVDGGRGAWHNRKKGGDDLLTALDKITPAPEPTEKLFPTPLASPGLRNGQHPDRRRSYGVKGSAVEMVDVATTFGSPDWRQYEGAVLRWEELFRPAPHPVIRSENGTLQLCARFCEWMMGWPDGWVDIEGVGRRKQLKMCGNGVVPQQAAGALRIMLTDLIAELTSE